jgi:hypothetical protein
MDALPGRFSKRNAPTRMPARQGVLNVDIPGSS